MGLLDSATVHSISVQTSQRRIKCAKDRVGKVLLSNIYALLLCTLFLVSYFALALRTYAQVCCTLCKFSYRFIQYYLIRKEEIRCSFFSLFIYVISFNYSKPTLLFKQGLGLRGKIFSMAYFLIHFSLAQELNMMW